MPLEFEHVINLSTYEGNPAPSYVKSLQIANEPDNEINQFYIYNDKVGDKTAQVTLSNYTELIWDGPYTRLATRQVKRIGIKSFPQIGAMAFYSLLHEERSFLLCPLFIKEDRYTKPLFAITQTETSLTFAMQTPEDITYICWRVVLRCGDTAFEYISYEDTLTVDMPWLSGEYDCYCVGYAGEGQAVSDDSDHVTLTIVGTDEDPTKKFLFYTKQEMDAIIQQQKNYIDSLVGNINTLLDIINGEVI